MVCVSGDGVLVEVSTPKFEANSESSRCKFIKLFSDTVEGAQKHDKGLAQFSANLKFSSIVGSEWTTGESRLGASH